MADTNTTDALLPLPPAPGTGPGPLGVPGGTDRSYRIDIIVCAILTAVIGSAFVALRLYVRRVIINVLGWEDWLIVAAQVFSIAMCAGFIHGKNLSSNPATEVSLGHGTHAYLIPAENFSPMAKAGWYTILFYELSLWCSQVSIMLLYIRIWNYPGVRRAASVLLALVMLYNVLVLVMVATACIPLRAFWEFELQVQGAYCHSKNIWWANTYLHIIIDFLIYLLPMPIIFRVHFQRRHKILLFVLFAFGFFICIISIIRLYMLKIVADTLDYTFDNVAIAFWSCVETNATVVIACFMTMKPLLSRWFPSIADHTVRGNDRPQNEGMADSNGRVPTIGSGPSGPRRAEQQQSWMFLGVDGHEKLEREME